MALGALPHSSARQVSVAGKTFLVEIADTPALRESGLSLRDSLAPGSGMLFVFDAPGKWGFWMKDTRIPLDMLWARGDGTIVTIARNVAPSTYPEIFYPASDDALYVLEVNAGESAGIAEGDKLIVE